MRILVRGDGIAAHLAAFMLARGGLEVVRAPVGNGDHGLGPIGSAVLGLPDWQASETANAIGWVPGSAFSLGVGFAGWGADRWFWPFGDTGAALDGVPFVQLVARIRAAGRPLTLADFSLAALAAREERFAPPSADPRSPLATLGVGVSYPADALAARLAGLAEDAGVVKVAPDCPADLVIDASGRRSADRWESWQDRLPCNRAASRSTPTDRPPPPYPLHLAGPDGWRAHVALDGAQCETTYTVDGQGTAYENGIDRGAWTGNRVAIGSAAAVIEPVLGTALLLVHDAIARLLTLLPRDPDDSRAEAAEYNRLTAAQAASAGEAASLLWTTNARVGEPLWDAVRGRATPALAHKLDLYRSRGHVPMAEDEPLSHADWVALLDGQGLRQRRLDPVAAALPVEIAAAHCDRIRARFAAEVRRMPAHADALARLRTSR